MTLKFITCGRHYIDESKINGLSKNSKSQSREICHDTLGEVSDNRAESQIML